MLRDLVAERIDILLISETKINASFTTGQLLIPGFSPQYDGWVHLLKCSLLSNADFELLSHTEHKWLCSRCIPENLPFHIGENTD